mmetsp:Transcript_36445/g.95990  ORF Transcript_36445/g.95990 Transcript_36445/m.95990 type:complete len:494 (+) Transcript_36445:93-1574(+)
MAEIDWSKLYQATSKANQPTPGYLFNDIVRDVSHAKPSEIPAVAEYLADCVDGDHAHVKLKALFVIKTLAYRVPPFCSCMQDRIPSVQDATSFTGPPSEMFGDEPYRLVREAADGALTALTGGQYYHEQYREMSQRIVGFGNYLPDDNTVLPDGTINVGRDVTYKDLTMSTVGMIGSGVGAILGGVKDILIGPFSQRGGGGGGIGGELGGLGGACGIDEGDDMGVDEGLGQDDFDHPHDLQDDDQDDCGRDEDGCYQPSTGSYVPPTLPVPSAAASENEAEVGQDVGDLFRPDLLDPATSSTSPAGLPCLLGEAEEVRGAEEDEGALFRLLGIPASGGATASQAAPAAAGAGEAAHSSAWPFREDSVGNEDPAGLSEAEILDILGVSSSASPPHEPAAAAEHPAAAATAASASATTAADRIAEAASLASVFLPAANSDPLAGGSAPSATSPTMAPPIVASPAPLSLPLATVAAASAGPLCGGPGCAGPGMLEV